MKQPSQLLRQKIPRKPKLLRSNPARLSYLANGNSFGYLIEDEDILTGYRINVQFRRQLQEVDDEDEELSDYVKARLLIARLLALQKYDEVINEKRA